MISAAEQARIRPQFDSVRYGTPDYGRLAQTCAEEIVRGADDDSEMGVFHNLYQPQRAANLRAANLRETILRGADLSEANLSEANMSEANLSEADLSRADLRWANLSEARGWTSEQLEQARVITGSMLPDGTRLGRLATQGSEAVEGPTFAEWKAQYLARTGAGGRPAGQA